MSYLSLVLLVYILSCFGFKVGSWVVLVCAFGLILSQTSFSFFYYSLFSEWIGMDEMSLLMVVLGILVMMTGVVSSFKDIKLKKNMGSMDATSVVEMVTIITLGSLVFFSVCSWMDFFFEFSLIPTLMLILKWGYQPERLQAGVYMMMYTVSGSLPLLISLLVFWQEIESDNMLLVKMISGMMLFKSNWVWVFLWMGFLVKLPVYGVHGWLPKAHVEAPLSGSMLLAGILLKFGGYGLIRFMWLTEVSLMKSILFLLVVSLWGGVLSSCICICQSDMKSLIAYSSVGHMAMSLGGVLSFYSLGKLSCVCLFFAHGLCSPILFSLAGSVYDFVGSRNIMLGKGLLRSFPIFSSYWFLFCVINMGFPPSLNFLSEVFCVGSLIWTSSIFMVLCGMMCFFTGCYCLVLYSLVNHGLMSELVNPSYYISGRYLYSSIFASIILIMGFIFIDYFLV
nr:NADH dehydrogenase subunit 4 [Venus verrucosa]UJH93150.1 NADH dehydrogenase subunit 4 [Venus verrucosa]UJH93176.1 NADH dehydrogenase subunit 4 [Venus verrucosa]UJH93202.1 NADH dehydrogenase subunit 4 [Venus verrucosa]UJH93241.1 NADH dehydrogenase subunit 4 [Venus verrucosa]